MSDLVYGSPERDVVELQTIYNPRVSVRNWTRYSFNSNFESPTDGWSFTIGDDDFPDELKDALFPGQLVQFTLNGLVQGSGYIDAVTRGVSRGGGTEWTIDGRDVFSPVVDAHIDPRIQFKKDTTLEQLVRTVFDRFAPGGGEWLYSFDASTNHKIKTGHPRRAKPGKKARGNKRLDQLRPGPHESAMTFVTTILHRQGLHVWPSVDGTSVIVDQPEFDQAPIHTLYRTPTASNIRDGTVKWSIADQPSIIIADGMSGGGEFGHSKTVAKMANPFTGLDTNGVKWPEVKRVSDDYKEASELFYEGITFGLQNLRWPRNYYARPLFLHDENATTLEELESFVRREMALRVRKALTVVYTVEGHGQYTPEGQFVPYEVDTLVRVNDVPGGVNTSLWVLARTFEKSRAGTTTRLELIIPGTLQFGAS